MKNWMYLVLGCTLGFYSSAAMAACSAPAGKTGSLYYNSADKTVKICKSDAWSAIAPSDNIGEFLFGLPTVGENGGNVVTLCTGGIGSFCGGGQYMGDGNLIVAPPGCTGSPTSPSCPADFNGIDTQKHQWRTSQSATNTIGSVRFGFAMTEALGNSSYPAMQFCKNLSYTFNGVTYSDWYLPTQFELMLIMGYNRAVRGFPTGIMDSTWYWMANSPTCPSDSSWCPNSSGPNMAGQLDQRNGLTYNWDYDIPHNANKTDSELFRCVRRN